MCPKITSIGLKGMEGYRINVEVKTFIGNDTIRIVGLPDAAVKESKERIMAAIRSLGYTVSGQKIIKKQRKTPVFRYGDISCVFLKKPRFLLYFLSNYLV
jgi:hypothetical protein